MSRFLKSLLLMVVQIVLVTILVSTVGVLMGLDVTGCRVASGLACLPILFKTLKEEL